MFQYIRIILREFHSCASLKLPSFYTYYYQQRTIYLYIIFDHSYALSTFVSSGSSKGVLR